MKQCLWPVLMVMVIVTNEVDCANRTAGSPPKLIGGTETHHEWVFISHDIELECKAQGWPRPKVRWFKDGQPIKMRAFQDYEVGRWKLTVPQAR